MKKVRIVLLISLLALVGAITGCQYENQISDECNKAYEKKGTLYGYVGDLPPECLKKSE